MIGVLIAHRREGIQVRHDDNLLRRFTFMRSNDRTARHVVPVFTVVARGINVSAVKGADIALVAHVGKLLAQIISGEHFCWRAGHPSRKNGGDVARLC
ncbi:hypothetical protein D3C78_738420 [compost metagenome]